MAHNDSYLEGMMFGNGDTQVNIPFHDEEALHDEDSVVKTNNITDGAVTKAKIAEDAVGADEIEDGAITEDHLSEDLKNAWDSQSPEFSITNKASHISLNFTNSGSPFFVMDMDDGAVLHLAFATGNDKSIQLKRFVDGVETLIAKWT